MKAARVRGRPGQGRARWRRAWPASPPKSRSGPALPRGERGCGLGATAAAAPRVRRRGRGRPGVPAARPRRSRSAPDSAWRADAAGDDAWQSARASRAATRSRSPGRRPPGRRQVRLAAPAASARRRGSVRPVCAAAAAPGNRRRSDRPGRLGAVGGCGDGGRRRLRRGLARRSVMRRASAGDRRRQTAIGRGIDAARLFLFVSAAGLAPNSQENSPPPPPPVALKSLWATCTSPPRASISARAWS